MWGVAGGRGEKSAVPWFRGASPQRPLPSSHPPPSYQKPSFITD
jgi:hypothetical protein